VHFALLLKIYITWLCHLQWENIDKIKEFNWNLENLDSRHLQEPPSLQLVHHPGESSVVYTYE
jgi:uncharacterized membrane protein